MSVVSQPISTKTSAKLADYVAIARLDHATKHVFILPGIVLAFALSRPALDFSTFRSVAFGFLSAIAIASANYVINEWLDRAFDAHHPEKSRRTAVSRDLRGTIVYAEYAILGAVGLMLASGVGILFFITSVAFALSGVFYNVQPIRSKDRAYIDVLSESINNPLRLLLGWTMIDPSTLPPSSLLLAYWMGGAFLMACKRLSEYREISVAPGGLAVLHLYRRSFRTYTAERLTVSCFLYAMLAAFFLAVFLMKYRIEYVVALPFLATLFALYLSLSMQPGSVAQKPERLFRERRLVALSIVNVMLLTTLTFVDIPKLDRLSVPYIVRMPVP